MAIRYEGLGFRLFGVCFSGLSARVQRSAGFRIQFWFRDEGLQGLRGLEFKV